MVIVGSAISELRSLPPRARLIRSRGLAPAPRRIVDLTTSASLILEGSSTVFRDKSLCGKGRHRASRRSRMRLLAASSQASSLAGQASSSLLSRRLRPSQAKVRSTTQRRLSSRNPRGSTGGAGPGPTQT
jgi:hypothetical protein